jgi:hypothetical protein
VDFQLDLKRIFNFDVYSISKSGPKYYATGQRSFLFSEDDAVTWSPLYKGLHNVSLTNQIIPHNQYVFFKGNDELFRSEDEVTYTPFAMPNSGMYANVCPANNLLFSQGIYGIWKVSVDNAASWTNFVLPVQNVRAFLAHKNKIVCYSENRVFFSEGSEFVWKEMNIPPGNHIYSMISTDSALYISAQGQTEPHLLVTPDLGNTWIVNHAPHIGTLKHAMGKIFVFHWDYGAKFTSDNGSSWHDRVSGLPRTIGNWSSPPDKLIAITDHKNETYCIYRHINQQMMYHVGVYKKLGNDTLWTEFNNGIEDYLLIYPQNPQQIFSNGKSLYLSINNKGVWRYGSTSNALVSANEHTLPYFSEEKIYPNPAIDDVTIFVGSFSKLKVFDSFGRLIISEELNTGENLTSIRSLQQGLYIFSITNKHGNKNIKVVVKN